jgi:hypothetical protein
MRHADIHPDPKPDKPEAFYDHYVALLVSLGTAECGLSLTDARQLAHEVLLASCGNVNRIPDVRLWLTATMRSAARLRQEPHVSR